MNFKRDKITVARPTELVKQRYVTRYWLGLFQYDVVVSEVSIGLVIRIAAEEEPHGVFVNGIQYKKI